MADTSPSSTEKSPHGICAYIWAVIVGFFVALFKFASSLAFRVTKGTREPESDFVQNMPNITNEPISKDTSRPPSPAPGFSKTDLVSSALKRLGDLEEKVDMLQAKPSAMPYEKEELLNAAVYRVDALEAELIATKKVIGFHFENILFALGCGIAIPVILFSLKNLCCMLDSGATAFTIIKSSFHY